MRRIGVVGLLALSLMALVLTGCEGYSETGSRSRCGGNVNSYRCEFQVNKANGATQRELEIGPGYPGLVLETDVSLTVGKGSYKIELLGKDDQVTLTLEARDGQTVAGRGQVYLDGDHEAHYNITATEAEDVQYTLDLRSQ